MLITIEMMQYAKDIYPNASREALQCAQDNYPADGQSDYDCYICSLAAAVIEYPTGIFNHYKALPMYTPLQGVDGTHYNASCDLNANLVAIFRGDFRAFEYFTWEEYAEMINAGVTDPNTRRLVINL